MTVAAASKATTTAPEANQTPAEKGTGPASNEPAAKRSFAFTLTTTISVPTEIPKRAPAQDDLPFKAHFTEALPLALKGEAPSLFIPDAYWVEERKAEKKLVNASYGRSKIMDQWRKWKFIHAKGKNTNEPVPEHKDVQITCIYRTGKEPGYNEPGIQFWIQKVS